LLIVYFFTILKEMTSINQFESPRTAKWLLAHFGCSPNNSAVIGDLDERYRSGNGHSRTWYWQQVAMAIAISFFKETWNHRARALAAVLAGWFAVFLFYLMLRPVSSYVLGEVQPDSPLMYAVFTRILPESWAFYYEHIGSPVLDLALRLVMVCFAGEISGRIVGSLDRVHRKPMVLAFALSVLAAAGWVFVDISLTDATDTIGFAWPVLAVGVVLLASVLHGGLPKKAAGKFAV
jgi:hypothetical protein